MGQNTGNAKGDGLGPWEVEKEVACGYGGRAWERAGKGGVGAGEVYKRSLRMCAVCPVR